VCDKNGRPIQTRFIRLSGVMGAEEGMFGTPTLGQDRPHPTESGKTREANS